MSFDEEKFLLILENEYTWPSEYIFKFIVPVDQKKELEEIFKGYELLFKNSKKGNYVSVTCKMTISESEEILVIYRKTSKIKGCISL